MCLYSPVQTTGRHPQQSAQNIDPPLKSVDRIGREICVAFGPNIFSCK